MGRFTPINPLLRIPALVVPLFTAIKKLSVAITTGSLWHFIIKPKLEEGINYIVGIANSAVSSSEEPAEEPIYDYCTSFLRNHKTAVTTLGEITQDVALPITDLYIHRSLALYVIPGVIDIHKVNAILKSKYFILPLPFTLRSYNFAAEYYNITKSYNFAAKAEKPLRALEFLAWFNLFGLMLPKFPSKLSAVYSIKFLDAKQQSIIKATNSTIVDTNFFILPFTKNSVSTLCKISIDFFDVAPQTKFVLEIKCNFLSESAYMHAENYLVHNKTLENYSQILDVSNPQNHYLMSKAVWKTLHQHSEKSTSDTLNKNLAYVAMAAVFPRSYVTNALKKHFRTLDTADILDPDTVAIIEFLGMEDIHFRETQEMITKLNKTGVCRAPRKDAHPKFLNLTENFYGAPDNDIEELLYCAVPSFFSTHYNNIFLPESTEIGAQTPANIKSLRMHIERGVHQSAQHCIKLFEAKKKYALLQQKQPPSYIEQIFNMLQAPPTGFTQTVSNFLSDTTETATEFLSGILPTNLFGQEHNTEVNNH